jgi:hypothetical protein
MKVLINGKIIGKIMRKYGRILHENRRLHGQKTISINRGCSIAMFE